MVQRAIIWDWNRVVVVEVGVDWIGRILKVELSGLAGKIEFHSLQGLA